MARRVAQDAQNLQAKWGAVNLTVGASEAGGCGFGTIILLGRGTNLDIQNVVPLYLNFEPDFF